MLAVARLAPSRDLPPSLRNDPAPSQTLSPSSFFFPFFLSCRYRRLLPLLFSGAEAEARCCVLSFQLTVLSFFSFSTCLTFSLFFRAERNSVFSFLGPFADRPPSALQLSFSERRRALFLPFFVTPYFFSFRRSLYELRQGIPLHQ